MQELIKNGIKEALKNLGINSENIVLEHPVDLKMGDYSTNVAMIYAKEMKTKPEDLAEKIVEEINKKLPKEISKIEAKNGFINFYLSKEFFAESVKEILKEKENFGRNRTGKNKKVIVEYSSPNIAKPFTVGHLRSTIIGDAISNILAFSNYNVIRDNHIGDWGTQFGKLIVAIKKWGNLSDIKKSDTPIKLLVDLYVKFHDELEKIGKEDKGSLLLEDGGYLLNESDTLEDEARAWFLKLEKKDVEATDIWERCILISKKEFGIIYKKLNVTPFDTEYGESFFEDKMAVVIDDVKEKKLGRESEGAFIIEFSEDKKLSPLLLLKKDGSSLYGLRDLATDKWRKKEYGDDIKIINEVGVEQTEYFKQIFEAEKMLGYFNEGQRVHVAHGLYRFQDGKMSTRKGNVIWLEDIINEAENRAGKINEETKEVVSIGALKFNDLKRESSRDIIFDWEEILNINGDSGPYMQYSYVRAKSILEKAKKENIKISHTLPKDWETTEIEKILYKFPEIVLYSSEKLEPHHVANYLIELARTFSAYYSNTQIVNVSDNTSSYKLAITEAFSFVMKNGLWLLGIETPEKM